MYYIVESAKSFSEVCFDLEPVAQRLGFEVLHRHDWGELLSRRGGGMDEECQHFGIVSHRYAEQLLNRDVRLGLMLPWQISVFTENGETRIALLRPRSPYIADAGLARVVNEIGQKLNLLVDEVR